MHIRPYSRLDKSSVIALWEACDLLRPWNDPRKDIQRKLKVQPELFLVGTIDKKIIASVMGGYEGHRGWIYYLAVEPEYQHRGFARILMDEVEARLAKLGCPKINLMVRGSNDAAVDFYTKLGYKQDDVLSLGKRLEPDD